ncbi:hypothetical protein H4218_003368 [Coemansia sp. IMI 209128]|nr:hypothetical protein H4218_003368 [Coemansia sp. IMI 209128]
MPTFSALQLLPPHLVRRIVDHVAGSSRLWYDDVRPDYYAFRELQMPLLWVCHNFRHFVYKRYCRCCSLDLVSNPDKAVATCNSWPRRLVDIDHPTSHQAKELYITLDVRDIYLSKSLQQLSNAPYEGCAFPMACIIRFRLTVDDKPGQTYEVHPPDIAANIAAFAQRIREVAPRVSEVYVDNDDKLQNLPMFQDAHFADLVRQLFGIVKTTVIRYVNATLLGSMGMERVQDLVRLECCLEYDASNYLSLICQNAQTLQALSIIAIETADYTGLFRDLDSGKYLEYPCLHTLHFFSFYDSSVQVRPSFTGAVPFPNLQHLSLSATHLIGDDVFFRGNAATLEYLRLELHTYTVEVLKQYRVFTPTSHPKLQCVKLDRQSDYLGGAFDTTDAYLRFVMDMAPNASVRVIPNL